MKARELTYHKQDITLIVAPLEELSDNHFAMNRMVANGNMFFIDDEEWGKVNLSGQVKLPLFIEVQSK